MTDAALFHAILCTSALFGLHDMMLHRKHMLESIRLINDRLPGEWATSDATISAILFMAKAEYLQGNHSAWCVHMDGVKRIIELRGGTMTLSCLIQHKIYSTDLLGCMEIGALPRFPAIDILKPVSSSYPYNLPPAVVSLAKSFILDHELLALLSEITTHMKSSPTSHDTLGDQYRLLSLCYQQPLRDCLVLTKRFSSQVQQVKSKIVQEVLMIGALLFLSLPHMCALPPIRPVDYSYLLSRLDSFASPLYADHQILLQHPEFLLWLSFLGVVFSSTSVSLSAGAHERSPFRLQLRAVSIMLEITSWHDMKIALGRMWSIDPKYEKPYRCLWENAVFGHDICYES
ncbi:hypothetical protein DE146DRAFT_626528 [Phaeosphaeria sp. MPI-PUGE-AT-0046c]|nr:hypothetical protein DE146DRAFT_626528 [Phaeosphaeria sp. MPI-PUGE-AT-0046c]